MPLIQRLAHYIPLLPDEIAILRDLQSDTSKVRRNRHIVREGVRYDSSFVLVEGFVIRSRMVPNGSRQVINIGIPGDLLDFPGSFLESAMYSVTSLTDVVLSSISHVQLLSLWKSCPSLASKIFWSFSSDAALIIEHLVDVGRRSALERIAHFLLEFHARLRIIGWADDVSFPMLLTQEILGDVLGLSMPHVNRTLRQLREDGLITIEDQRVVIMDREALDTLADFKGRPFVRFSLPDAFQDLPGSAADTPP